MLSRYSHPRMEPRPTPPAPFPRRWRFRSAGFSNRMPRVVSPRRLSGRPVSLCHLSVFIQGTLSREASIGEAAQAGFARRALAVRDHRGLARGHFPRRVDAEPGVAQPPKARIPAGATQSAPKTPGEPRVPQIRSETTPSRLAGDPDCSPALLYDRSPHLSLSPEEEALLHDL